MNSGFVQGLLLVAFVALGAVLGIMTGSTSLLPFGCVAAAIFCLVGWVHPASMIILIGSTILLESEGIIATVVIPWTLAKVIVAGSMVVWFLRQVSLRKPLMVIGPETFAMSFILVSMLTSLFFTIEFSTSVKQLIPTILVFALSHLVLAMGQEARLERVLLWLVPAALAYLLYGALFAEFESGRLEGSSDNPNLWAMSLSFFCLPLLGALAGSKRILGTIIFSVVLVLLLLNVSYTASRSALLALLPAIPIVLLSFRNNVGVMSLFIVPAVVGFFLFADLSMVFERFESAGLGGAEYSAMHREEAIWVGLTVFEQNWMFGTGIATFPFYFAMESHSGFLHAAHNMYVNLMAETGTVGIVSAAFWFFIIGRSVIRTLRASWNTKYEGAVLGLTAMLVAWAISGLFADLFIDTLVFFYLGFLFSIDRHLQRSPESVASVTVANHQRALMA